MLETTPTMNRPAPGRASLTARLLDRVMAGDVKADPFPHAVVPDALDAEHYRALAAGLPGLDRLREEHRAANDRRVDLGSSSGRAQLAIDDVPAVRGKFLRRHASDEVVSDVVALLAGHIPGYAPRLYQEILVPARKRSLDEPRQQGGGPRFARLRPLSWPGRSVWLDDSSHPRSLDVQGRPTPALDSCRETGSGWRELCDFPGRPIPAGPFPRGNPSKLRATEAGTAGQTHGARPQRWSLFGRRRSA